MLQTKQISLNEAKKIIDNIDVASHISFIGGESFLFPGFIDLLQYLDEKGITYDITTNGILVSTFTDKLNSLKNLQHIIFSVDFYGKQHDEYRNINGLFETIINTIPKLIMPININSIIFEETKEEDIYKLYLLFWKLGIEKYFLLVDSIYTEAEYRETLGKIPNLEIQKYSGENMNYTSLNKKALICYQKILLLKKKLRIETGVDLYPKYLIRDKNSCKHLKNQIRINENGNISICHYINNECGSLIENKLSKVLYSVPYATLKEAVHDSFPLGICNHCCSKI